MHILSPFGLMARAAAPWGAMGVILKFVCDQNIFSRSLDHLPNSGFELSAMSVFLTCSNHFASKSLTKISSMQHQPMGVWRRRMPPCEGKTSRGVSGTSRVVRTGLDCYCPTQPHTPTDSHHAPTHILTHSHTN